MFFVVSYVLICTMRETIWCDLKYWEGKLMAVRSKTVFSFVFAGVLTAFGAISLATDPYQGTPGWKYGGLHCGCTGNQNADRISCLACCSAAAQSGSMPAADLSGCQAFCRQAAFPCYGSGG